MISDDDDRLQIHGADGAYNSDSGSCCSEMEEDEDELNSVSSSYHNNNNNNANDNAEPYLITLLHNHDWAEALTRLSTHPHEVYYQGGTRQFTALHEACCIHHDDDDHHLPHDDEEEMTSSLSLPWKGSIVPPVELICALIAASGENIVRTKSVTGETPLHLLCASDIEDEEEEEWTSNSKNGATINEIIRIFLLIDPSLATIKCHEGWTALQHTRRAWSAYAWSEDGRQCIDSAIHGTSKRRRTSQSQQYYNSDKDKIITATTTAAAAATRPMDLTGTLRVLFDRIDLLLYAAIYNKARSSKDNNNHHHSYCNLLHCAASPEIDGNGGPMMPASFVQLAATLCGEQGYERETKTGMTPLCIAASCNVFLPSSSSRITTTTTTTTTAMYDAASQECGKIVKTLISACPDTAGIADVNGRLPLQLALESGYRWYSSSCSSSCSTDDDNDDGNGFGGDGIQAILSDAPRALGTRDVTTHLYPFMTAAVGAVVNDNDHHHHDDDGNDKKNDLSDLDTIYKLLRQSPMIAFYGLATTTTSAVVAPHTVYYGIEEEEEYDDDDDENDDDDYDDDEEDEEEEEFLQEQAKQLREYVEKLSHENESLRKEIDNLMHLVEEFKSEQQIDDDDDVIYS